MYLLALAVLPPILIAYYVYRQDKYEKEPKRLIIKSFLFGCFAIIPAVVLELIFNETLFPTLFLYVLFGIAFIEEGLKYFFLKKYMYVDKEFNEPMDGIVYAVMISLGFATVENIAYVMLYASPGEEMSVAILRMFSAIPLHAACGVILGYYVGLAKFSKKKERELLYTGLAYATLVHAVYNYFLFAFAGYYWIASLIALLIAIYYSKKAIKLHQEDSRKRTQ